jgi:hypothetical protein
MSRAIPTHLKHIAMIFLLITHGIPVANAASACHDTPSTAIDALSTASLPSQASESSGYRVVVTQWDPVLGKRWAKVASCDHPERPTLAVLLGESDLPGAGLQTGRSLAHGTPVPIVVHAGDVVRLWHQEVFLRIETAGVSEESGGIGKTIRMRLLHRNAEDQSTTEHLLGVIRGPLDVEMQR